MKKATLTAVGIAVIAALVITFGSPYIALYQIKSAIADHDADAVSEHVDFPAVRESLKGQLMGGVMSEFNKPEMKSNPFAGVGKALGAAILSPMIDAMVSPAGIIALMQRTNSGPDSAGDESEQGSMANYKLSFKGWGKVVIYREGSEEVSLTMRRYGIWDWKLTAINMPPDTLKL
ncbi:DUF2939 domain-containing protein [Duganella fentianensis]|uniref:DUF2939 domain-containing protein n=1 Tax=Duganella fentianensis TaxID=2692177 RepID=UPI0032B1ADA6